MHAHKSRYIIYKRNQILVLYIHNVHAVRHTISKHFPQAPLGVQCEIVPILLSVPLALGTCAWGEIEDTVTGTELDIDVSCPLIGRDNGIGCEETSWVALCWSKEDLGDDWGINGAWACDWDDKVLCGGRRDGGTELYGGRRLDCIPIVDPWGGGGRTVDTWEGGDPVEMCDDGNMPEEEKFPYCWDWNAGV